MQPLHTEKEIVANRYQIVTISGEGGMGITYEAIDLTNSQTVALKVVSLRQASDWKVLELFEREAKVLATLDLPGIPHYLDYFELDTPKDRRFYLVQELVEGKSLAELVNSGWHATEAEVKAIAIQLLDILVYLHSRSPAVIHRDIKPQNIIRQADGKVYLVDFGAVQDIYRNTVSRGQTFVGTLGYMSLEQLRGEVSPVSDLYSLGCSLLFLLTHRSPNDLPQKEMKLDFASKINVSPEFQEWLSKILEPIPEDRFQSAKIAKKALQQESIVNYSLQKSAPHRSSLEDRPLGSRIILTKSDRSLQIKIPLGKDYNSHRGLFTSGFEVVFGVFISLAIFPELALVGLLVCFFYFLTIPNRQTKPSLKKSNPASHHPSGQQSPKLSGNAEKYVMLEINPRTFYLQQKLRSNRFGINNVKKQENSTPDIQWINFVGGEGTKEEVIIATKTKQYSFGKGYLNKQEARWIVREIEQFIDRVLPDKKQLSA